MSLKRLILGPRGIREPYKHANTPELAYALSGEALVSVLDLGSIFSLFTTKAGDMFRILSGSLHHIENLSDNESCEFLVCFSHERPKDSSLSAAFGVMILVVLGNTYNVPASSFKLVNFSTDAKEIITREGKPTVLDTAYLLNLHKLNVECIGSLKPARSQLWPALIEGNLAMYSVTFEDTRMREPH